MWCVGELGLAVERRDAGHRFGVVDTPEFRVMNPNGLVPVLVDGGGEPLWEAGAILRYLAARYGTNPLWPAAPGPRAQVDKWAEWAKVHIAAGFTVPVFWRAVRTAPRDRDSDAIRRAVDALSRQLDIAERRLSAVPFIAGDRFTLADIQLGHLLFRYFDLPIERPRHPALRRYDDGLAARPAYREHVMVSYEALRAA